MEKLAMVSHFTDKTVSGRASLAFAALTLAFFGIGLGSAHGQIMRGDAIPMAKSERASEPFSGTTRFAPAGPLWIKWQDVDIGLARDEETIARCRADQASCLPAAAYFVALIDAARTLSGRSRLAIVNRAINLSIAYTSDERQFGTADVWSSPVTTFTSGRGDCEDYAIAKMFTLRAAGIPQKDLRLLVARLRGGGNHALLAVREEDRWLLLDNRSMTLVEDTDATDLRPLYTLEAAGVHQFGEPEIVASAAPAQEAAIWPASAPAPLYLDDPFSLDM